MSMDQQPAVRMRELVVDGARGKLAARLCTPLAGELNGLIVFYPPGSFVSDELQELESFMQMLAERSGCCVLGTSYTLAAEQPFPAAVEDAYAVLSWAHKHRAKLGCSSKRLMTCGIEAGGNLAAVAALVARDRGGPELAAQLLIMPMLDPGLTSCSMRQVSAADGSAREADACAAGYRDYLPRATDRTHPYACPLQSSRMKGLPPALILSAEDDPLRDEAEQYGAKLAAAGIRSAVRRLPPLPLQDPDARCSCVRGDEVLNGIAGFLAGLP
jgi:acetyl esterase